MLLFKAKPICGTPLLKKKKRKERKKEKKKDKTERPSKNPAFITLLYRLCRLLFFLLLLLFTQEATILQEANVFTDS